MTRNLPMSLITGGAGFIGSHLIERLIPKGVEIRVLDNLSSGNLNNIAPWLEKPNFTFIKGDLLNFIDTIKVVKECEIVYHLAANPEVKVSSIRPDIHFRQNVEATYNLLEAIRSAGNIEKFIFISSSTVYGEASRLPTPEDYAPMEPISIYGASKLACEALIAAYAHTYGFNAVVFRPANIVGPRSKQGVVHDFIEKLLKNPKELVILGDGQQTKSYLHISDFIKAMFIGMEKSNNQVEIFNVGSEDQISVKAIAEVVAEEMNLKNVVFNLTGGVDGGRGWKGDVKNMLLDVNKIKALGWKPTFNSLESIRIAIRQILSSIPSPHIFKRRNVVPVPSLVEGKQLSDLP